MVRSRINKFERSMMKITPIQPSIDNNGNKYFNYCDYHHHPGIIGEYKSKKCIRIKCEHLHKYTR